MRVSGFWPPFQGPGGAAPGPGPETPGITLFAQGFSVESTYLALRRDMPDETERAAMRVAAIDSIPGGQ